MAKKQENKKVLERTYTVPLRKEFRKVPHWKKTKKAVTALKQFLSKHMKSEEIRLSKEVNEKLWQHGIRNPPGKIKVNVTKDQEGIVKAELFGAKKKETKKAPVKKETKSAEVKKEETKEKKETPQKVEEKKAEPVVEPKKEVEPRLQDSK